MPLSFRQSGNVHRYKITSGAKIRMGSAEGGWKSREAREVTFEEAATVFGEDALGRTTIDHRHSEDEERFVLAGTFEPTTLAGRNVRGARGSNPHHQRTVRDAPRAERL